MNWLVDFFSSNPILTIIIISVLAGMLIARR